MLALFLFFIPCFSATLFPQMLEISTRPWLYSLSQKYGNQITTLRQIPTQEFQAIKNAGYDIVWMMGMWRLGQYGLNYDQTNPGLQTWYNQVLPGWTQADVIGSPYAVVNYTTNPTLGNDSDLTWLKGVLNGMGLELMLDFVPNHSGVDAVWTNTLSNYIREPTNVPHNSDRFLPNGVAFGWDGYGNSWQDTAQFNYWDQNLRNLMTNQVLRIAASSDYIRCDMAHLLLNNLIQNTWGSQLSFYGYKFPATEAWSQIISTVKARYPNVKFLAEVYAPNQQALQGLGFDFTYDKTLYDKLSGGNLDDIRGYIAGMPLNFHQKSAHFVENHDEPRAASFFSGNSRADGAAAVVMTLPGMRFYNEGQQDGFFNKLDIHLRRGKAENTNTGVLKYYGILTSILKSPIFHQGSWKFMNVFGTDDSWRLMAWQWQLGDTKVLCVINYSDTKGTGKVLLPDAIPVNGNDMISVTELISGAVYQRSVNDMKQNGLFAIVDYWSIQMFQFV